MLLKNKLEDLKDRYNSILNQNVKLQVILYNNI